MTLRETALGRSGAYRFVQRALGARQAHESFLADHVRIAPGQRMLDLGCGPGDLVEHLRDVDYVGVDLSPEYIATARRRHGDRARFLVADVRADVDRLVDEGRFDRVVMVGVLHHLADAEVGELAGVVARLLAPQGRLVTLDPARLPGQRGIRRWLIDADRGEHIRAPAAYVAALGHAARDAHVTVRRDLSRVPYDHVVLDAALSEG